MPLRELFSTSMPLPHLGQATPVEKGAAYTNQQFPIVPDEALEKLGRDYSFSFWQKVDEKRSAVRFCTSWATTEEAVDALIASIAAL